MSTPPTGHCCVCGKETKDRCGACGKAGFNLFFGSREHQKLVWFAHKRICGSRTKPFSFPPLTEDEIEYAKDHINVSYGIQRRGSVTLATELTEMCFSFNSLLLNRPEALHVLLDDLGGDSQPSPLFTLGQRNELISQIRTVFFAIRRTLESDSPAPHGYKAVSDVALQDAEPHTLSAKLSSHLADVLAAERVPAFPATEDWYIRFQHAAVVFCALRYLLLRDSRTLAATSPDGPATSRIMELDGLIRTAKGEFIKFGNETRATRPVQSAAVLELVQKALYDQKKEEKGRGQPEISNNLVPDARYVFEAKSSTGAVLGEDPELSQSSTSGGTTWANEHAVPRPRRRSSSPSSSSSTSASPPRPLPVMTPSTSGACCVCGKETTQRCGACAKHGFDLFFCSTEHQRMAWFAHKQVCGPRSKPFQFPPLSKETAQNVTSHLTTPYKLGDGDDVTLKDALTNLCFVFDRTFLLSFPLSSLIHSLQVGQTPFPHFTLDQRNELLCHIHHASFAIRRRTVPSLSSNRSKRGTFDVPLEFLHPTAVLAKFGISLGVGLRSIPCTAFPSNQEWYSTLCHRVLVISALHYLAHQDRLEHSPPLLNAIDPYKEASHVALITAAAGQIGEVTEKMRTSHPRERDEVVKLLDQIDVHSLPSA